MYIDQYQINKMATEQKISIARTGLEKRQIEIYDKIIRHLEYTLNFMIMDIRRYLLVLDPVTNFINDKRIFDRIYEKFKQKYTVETGTFTLNEARA